MEFAAYAPTPKPVVQPGETDTKAKDEAKTQPTEEKSDVIQIRKSTIIIVAASIAAIVVLLIVFFAMKRKGSDDIYIETE